MFFSGLRRAVRRSGMLWGAGYALIWMDASVLVDLPANLSWGLACAAMGFAHLRHRTSTYLRVGIGITFFGNEYAAYAYAVSLVPVAAILRSRPGYLRTRPQKLLWCFLAWCLLACLVSQFREGNLGAFAAFLVTFVSPAVYLAIGAQLGKSKSACAQLTSFFGVCLLWQASLVVAHGIAYGYYGYFDQPGDWAVGSSRQPGISIAFAGGLLYGLSALAIRRGMSRAAFPGWPLWSRRRGLAFVSLAIWMLYLTHTRMLNYSVLAALGVGSAALLLFRPLVRVLRREWLGVVTVAASAAVCGLIWRFAMVPSTSFNATGLVYVTNPHYNHKVVYLKRAVGDIPHTYGTWITGTGPGTVGTRAANSRAYDTLYKPKGSRLPSWIPAYTSAPAQQYFVDLYQRDFVEMTGKSQTLAGPFSSLISIFVELGIGGTILFALLFWTMARHFVRLSHRDHDPLFRSLGIALLLLTLTLLFVSSFETVLERPLAMVPYWLFAGISVGRLRVMSRRRRAPRVPMPCSQRAGGVAADAGTT